MIESTVISSDKVEGTNVYNVSGEKLGSVDDLMIDRHSGQVKYAVLEFGGFLGMGRTDIRFHGPCSSIRPSRAATSCRSTRQHLKARQNIANRALRSMMPSMERVSTTTTKIIDLPDSP